MQKTEKWKEELSITKQEDAFQDVSERITALRFLLAVCVVLIHNFPVEQGVVDAVNIGENVAFSQSLLGKWIPLLFSQGLCRCAVPLFFMFAAYLQVKKSDSYQVLLKKNLIRIVIGALYMLVFYLSFCANFAAVYSARIAQSSECFNAYMVSFRLVSLFSWIWRT